MRDKQMFSVGEDRLWKQTWGVFEKGLWKLTEPESMLRSEEAEDQRLPEQS